MNSISDVSVFTVEFNSDGEIIKEQKQLNNEELTNALLVDRLNLQTAYQSLSSDGYRVKINERLGSTTTASNTSDTSRSLYGSTIGLLIGPSDVDNGELSSSEMTGRATATDPGLVRLRDRGGNYITSSDGTPSGYQIDGMSDSSAEAITTTRGRQK